MAHQNNKFVSVNLNRSYGQPSNPCSYPSNLRSRSASTGGGGGGMVVLSRPRSSSSSSAQKGGSVPKLSVPPPLNLPSLRKENEKFDLSSSSSSSARPGSSGIGSGLGSSSMGWTRPAQATALLQEKEAPLSSGRSGSGSSYMPPAARGIGHGVPVAEKAVFLSGDEFPSLKATVNSSALKQKDLLKEKAKEDERERAEFSCSSMRMRPQIRSSRLVSSNVSDGDEKLQKNQQQQQEKYFPGPLPYVKLTHTSDWADDERDTGLSLPERDRDRGFLRSEELYKGDSFGIGPNKDGCDAASSWRMPPPQQQRDDRVGNRDTSFNHSPYGNNASTDSRYRRRDLGFGMNSQNFYGRSNDQQNMRGGRYDDYSNNRYRGDSFQHNAVAKAPFSYRTKGPSLNDPILNFGKEKRLNSPNSGFDSTDPFSDDPIADVNMKVFKRKKEIQKQVDFHDPVRESFEAELERVQRIQEQERQRVMEEQERVMELARREQEERERVAREEEERRRSIEEEAREASWRAEQERMEAAKRAEEQKIAREEEKRRLFIEEERRKEAARQKLLELEARIARRQSENNQKDDKVQEKDATTQVVATDVGDWEDGERMVEHITSTVTSDSSTNRYHDTGSSRFSSTRDMGSSFMERGKHGNYLKRDAYDNGTSSMFHSQNQENDYRGIRRDAAFSSNRDFQRKDNYGGNFRAAPMRPTSKGSTSEHSSTGPEDFHYSRGNRWNASGEGDHYARNLDVDGADFLENDRFGDGGWEPVRSQRPFQNSEVDGGFPSYGRSRHSLRQPRVLPPPIISSTRQSLSSFRATSDRPISSSFHDNHPRYQHGRSNEEEIMRSGYDNTVFHQRVQQPRTLETLESDVISSEQQEKDSPRCDSQSSLSVSNPPSSPTQLSHDDLDEAEAEDSQALKISGEEQTILSDNEVEITNSNGEDDEWAVEANEEMQDQEEYDEEDDGANLDLNEEFDGPSSDEPNATDEIGQSVLGFDEGVAVAIPLHDDLEKSSQKLDKEVNEDSAGDHTFTEELISEPSKIMNETEKALQDLVLDPVTSSSSNILDNAQSTTVQLPVASTSTVQPISSTVSTVDTQAEAPIRLQFGLFSGPSLIPSPIPAIQIGSIQMPLHLHPRQPPFFQFGQLRYPSPLTQGILPLASQTVSFVHPPASTQYPSTQKNLGASPNNQASEKSSSQKNSADKLAPGSVEEQPGLLTKPSKLSPDNIKFEVSAQGQTDASADKNRQFLGYQNNRHVIRDVSSRKNYRPVINNRESLVYPGEVSSRAPGIISNSSRGKRFTYTVRNAPFSMPDNSRTDSNVFQRRQRRSIRRTEFRVRENVDERQREEMDIINSTSRDRRPNYSGRVPNRSTKAPTESENFNFGASSSRVASYDGKVVEKLSEKEIPLKKNVSSLENSHAEGDNGKRNVSIEEDVDAPIQSGIVRVFKQPGIETPSDEDDFIEVRSKRQMLNDRREQREKEIKAKSKLIKAPRKHCVPTSSNAIRSNSNKAVSPLGGNTSRSVRSGPVITSERGFAKVEASPVFTSNVTSQPLPPIGTPQGKVDSNTKSNNLKPSQTSTMSVPSSAAAKFVPGLSFDSKNTGLVNASLSLGSWSNPDVNQQVMALTQSQLDDAMKPVQFDAQVAPSVSVEPTKLSTSIMSPEPFLPSANPLNSLLAGERIQFGAVTSPTILPPVGIGAPGSSRSDVSKDNLSASNNENMYFDKDKHPKESCARLEDPESEAEAAASAVAVAAISNNDEIIGSNLGVERFSEDNTETKTSGAGQEQTTQSTSEESLTVSLPADLSVDTPALPLWQPLPSPQSTSGPTLSHFPGGPHSHFPMGFDMNPIFGGPIFALNPHDESAGGTQAQPQRSTTLGSGPLGPWPHHSGVDSFYGPPAGFTGPYISPGVQAPPHMVVYNHFAPVGQFGQVGLSFMGTTYIPTGKQPDWKHNPVSSSTIGVGEGDIGISNVVPGQRNQPGLPSPMQHLSSSSPLMPMAPPLAMFDMSPFQATGDIPFQARWSHVPVPPIHSVPLDMHPQQMQHQQHPPQQHQKDSTSQINDPRSSISVDANRNFSVSSKNIHSFPTNTGTNSQIIRPPLNTTSNKVPNNSSKISSRSDGPNTASLFNNQSTSSSSHLHHSIGVGASHKPTSSGGEWHRRMGYHSRGHASGSDKGFTTSKMKQIYVAKPPTSGPPTTG